MRRIIWPRQITINEKEEPLMKRFPESELIKPCEPMVNDVVPEKTEYSGSRQTLKAN